MCRYTPKIQMSQHRHGRTPMPKEYTVMRSLSTAQNQVKCDRRIPSCSQCIKARAECAGSNPRGGEAPVPRSIVQFLEDEIATLETELSQMGGLDILNASDILILDLHRDVHGFDVNRLGHIEDDHRGTPSLTLDPIHKAILESEDIQTMIAAVSPLESDLTDLVSQVRMGLTPSSSKVSTTPTEIRRSAISPRADRSTIDIKVLKNLPVSLAKSLTEKYIHHLLPQYPFLQPDTIRDQLECVLEFVHRANVTSPVSSTGLCRASSYDCLIIYLIMAISVTLGSAKGGHQGRCFAFSNALYEEGIQHWPSRSSIPSDLAEVQLTLLILLFASINPRAGNVWVLCGTAMRLCFQLGLHREAAEMKWSLGPETLDLRRRIFWSAYCLDRSICSVLHRPLSIPDAAIDAPFPSIQKNPQQNSILAAMSGAYIQWSKLHRLQSEMIEVHFQGGALPEGMSWDDWLVYMEERGRTLNKQWQTTTKGVDEMKHFSFCRFLFTLHRPSPRVPFPSESSLLTCFEAATQWAQIAKEHFEHGYFRRPWFATHHNFEAAMVVLFSLRHAGTAIRRKFDTQQLFERTKLLTSNFLIIASQGWGEVAACAGIYERLLGTLLESVFSPDHVLHFSPTQDSELNRYLYPGPAQSEPLRFGMGPDLMSLPDDLFESFTNEYAVTATGDHAPNPHDGTTHLDWDLLDHWFMDDGFAEITTQ
uniref:Pyrimidine pathway regulatory protein 1 n=3 Tax=Talaromyces marneffei PM1 TaxID=1077442 RepID=A0A093V5X4_TALMA